MLRLCMHPLRRGEALQRLVQETRSARQNPCRKDRVEEKVKRLKAWFRRLLCDNHRWVHVVRDGDNYLTVCAGCGEVVHRTPVR